MEQTKERASPSKKQTKPPLKTFTKNEQWILRTIATYGFLPRNPQYALMILNQRGASYRKSIEELRAYGYIESEAVFIERHHNQRDAWVLTKRGTRACNRLGFEIKVNRASVTASREHHFKRAKGELFVEGVVRQGTPEIDAAHIISREVYEYAKTNKKDGAASLGLQAASYIRIGKQMLACYVVEKSTPMLFWARERAAYSGACEKEHCKDTRATGNQLPRVILVESDEAIGVVQKTRKGSKWFRVKDSETGQVKQKGLNIKRTLYYRNESEYERGVAYMWDMRTPLGKEYALYDSPLENEARCKSFLRLAYEKSEGAKEEPVLEVQKYMSAYETKTQVVFAMTVVELHAVDRILEIASEEEREIVVVTTKKQYGLVRTLMKEGNVKVYSIDAELFMGTERRGSE